MGEELQKHHLQQIRVAINNPETCSTTIIILIQTDHFILHGAQLIDYGLSSRGLDDRKAKERTYTYG